MKFVTSILNRRAFMALAAASMLAGVMHSAPVRRRTRHSDHRQGHHLSTGRSFWPAPARPARTLASTCRNSAPRLKRCERQVSILENAVAGNPAAIVIAPTEFKALGKPIDEAAAKVKVIGIDSGADSKAFTSFLTTDNVQGGRVAADGLAAAIGAANGGKIEGDVALITNAPGAGSLEQRKRGFTSSWPRSIQTSSSSPTNMPTARRRPVSTSRPT
jgi:ribose transport system substrate-binding protein